MENVTRTLVGAEIQTCMITNLPYIIRAHTTLNEKFNIQNGILPDASTYPSLQYLTVGNGGHTFTIGANGIPKPDILSHQATDTGLYRHIPMVMRQLNDDLAASERVNYALRRIETWNNIQYVVYYLKRIDYAGVVPTVQLVTVENGVKTAVEYQYTSANLNPDPQNLNNSGTNTTTGEYVSATARLNVNLTTNDMEELGNVANVMYGDPGYSIISEIGLCTGVDKVVTVAGPNNTTFSFNEAIVVQLASIVSTIVVTQFSNSGVSILLDLGISEPLAHLA